ncbi:hypothetical protein BDZ94DRAFT_1195093 [Collybia nuda]|uniref:Uncharacterized protein n=1 Tax=Collybia nuda TaxID=64659 RepID=A0A9P5Y3S3_9AGAR|nr:hypothetical protein BDZ94DRAFT_1195093 [Collybia nuda]
MHHRAIRHIQSAPNATTLTFSALLQAAAGRAWSRSASLLHQGANSPSSLVTSSPAPTCNSPAPRQHTPPLLPLCSALPRMKQETSVAHIQPEEIQDSDLRPVDPGRSLSSNSQFNPAMGRYDDSKPSWYWKDSNLTTLDSERQPDTRPSSIVSPAKTRVALYQNLLYLLSHRDPVFSLPTLLDYHDLHTGLRSTRSYNLLVAQALRHASYGTVQWLLKAMKADGLPGNIETWKLKVRWLIQTGWWDQAWNEVMESRNWAITEWAPPQNSPIPPQIWLEFFRTLKRAPARRRYMDRWEQNSSSHAAQNLEDRPDSTILHLARFHTVTANCPMLTPKGFTQASPRMVYFVVMTMLRSQQAASALSFTQAFFKALPPSIPSNWVRTCQEIIHLHIALGSSQRGLRRLYECRRTMVTLTKTHSALKPTSTSLLLLLSPLRHAKRCGTVAWNICRSFRRQWGTKTVDRRVRRRIMTLAVKEGRMDIVDKILSSEKTYRWAHGMWKKTTLTLGGTHPLRPRKILRPPAKKLFRYNGREERLWQLFRRRKRRVLARRRTK